jgi:iron complex transport system substrate-binding protein
MPGSIDSIVIITAKRGLLRAALAVSLLVLSNAWSADFSPSAHHAVKPAERIVTLAPHLTELVYAAGAGSKLVGVSAYSDFPAEAKTQPVIGDASAIDMERLISLRPDLVLAWKGGNHPADNERLAKLGIKVFTADSSNLDDIPRLLKKIGGLAGTQQSADRSATDFEQRLATIKQRYAARPKLKVFFEIWHGPLITVNGEHYISEALAACGADNIFAAARSLTPVVGMESLLAANPDAIIASTSADNHAAVNEWKNQTRPAVMKLGAVKNNRIFFVHPDLVQRQTPRLLDGIEQMCEQLETIRVKAN